MSSFRMINKRIIITFILSIITFSSLIFSGCKNEIKNQDSNFLKTVKKTGSMKLDYANKYKVDYYQGGYSLVTIADSEKYLLIPKNKKVPNNLDKDITPIKLPLKNVYLLSSASMDLFKKINALSSIKMTGTKPENWSDLQIKKMVENNEILFGGKYSAPDYEMILENKCDLAIESTMIFHTPKVKEKLEELGIPVMVERLSYESHPLGRSEWIKLYGLLSGKINEANKYMKDSIKRYNSILSKVKKKEKDKKKVVYFYISQNGYISVKKPGDYITKIINLAGADYVFKDIAPEEDNALSVMHIDMETFFKYAKDADYIIYNSSIEGELKSKDQLIKKNELFKELKAFKGDNVWCTKKDLFQETTGTVNMIEDVYNIINDNKNKKIYYLYKLK